jgi:hypothetical protein
MQADLLVAGSTLTNDFAAGEISPSAYSNRTSELERRRKALDDERAAVGVNPDALRSAVHRVLEIATSLCELYERFDDRRQAELLRAVFETVVIGQQGIVGYTLRPPFGTIERVDEANVGVVAAALVDAA